LSKTDDVGAGKDGKISDAACRKYEFSFMDEKDVYNTYLHESASKPRWRELSVGEKSRFETGFETCFETDPTLVYLLGPAASKPSTDSREQYMNSSGTLVDL